MLLAHPVVHSFTSQAAKIVALARNGQVSEGFRMKIGGWLVAFAALALRVVVVEAATMDRRQQLVQPARRLRRWVPSAAEQPQERTSR